VRANEVLVPTLVRNVTARLSMAQAGRLHSRRQRRPQKIRVQEEMDTAPVALVVAVEEAASRARIRQGGKLGRCSICFYRTAGARRR